MLPRGQQVNNCRLLESEMTGLNLQVLCRMFFQVCKATEYKREKNTQQAKYKMLAI
jgi:hypothetical protein